MNGSHRFAIEMYCYTYIILQVSLNVIEFKCPHLKKNRLLLKNDMRDIKTPKRNIFILMRT